MKNINIIILAFLSVLFTGCEDFWNNIPKASLTPENFYKTDADFQSAVYGIYSYMSVKQVYNTVDGGNSGNWGQGLFLAGELGTDASTFTTASQIPFATMATNSVTPSNSAFDAIWATQYAGINAANLLIKYAKDSVTSASIAQYAAEARFLRGFYYFTLVRLFGGVPLVLNPGSDSINIRVKRDSIAACYRLIISDFKYAYSKLPDTYTAGVGRATKAAAGAFLAKTYLTMATSKLYSHIGDPAWSSSLDGVNSLSSIDAAEAYNKATSYTKQVIDAYDAGKNKMTIPYAQNFYPYENTSEILFDVQFATGLNVYVGGSLGSISGPLGNSYSYWCMPTRTHVEGYGPTDVRRRINCDNISLSGTSWSRKNSYTNNYVKFQKDINPSYAANQTPINLPLMRLSEVYLMLAESLAGAVEAQNPNGQVPQSAFDAINVVARSATQNGTMPTFPIAATGVVLGRDMVYTPFNPYDTSHEIYNQSTLSTLLGQLYGNPLTGNDVETKQLGIFRNLILRERDWEFAGESQRWYDLVRMGKLFSAISNQIIYTTNSTTNNGLFDGPNVAVGKANINKFHILRPIPAKEINYNPNIIQNSGY